MINELVVYQKRLVKRIRFGLLLVAFSFFCAFKAICFTVLKYQWWGIYIVLGGLLFFVVYLAHFFYWTIKELNRPVLVINEKGIWNLRYGLLKWENIILVDEIDGPQPKNAAVFERFRCYYLGIKLKNRSELLSIQTTIEEKIIMVQTDNFYDIVFSDFDTPSSEIVLYARQYLE